MTTPRNHFEAFLDGVRREGRYRIFTDLERHADRPPYATWRGEGIGREVVAGVRMTILGWDAIPLSSTRCLRRHCGMAPALEGPQHLRQ
jgi:hypothetical protein